MKLLREYRFYTMLALLLIIPVISLNTSNKEPSEFSTLDEIVVTITGPLQTAITYTIDQGAQFFENYVLLHHLRADYSEAVEENRRLQNTIHNLKEIEVENQRLRALLQFEATIQDKKITAQVIATDVSSDFRSIRINKGSASGLTKGMPVVTHEGIVGRVLRVTKNYSDILTILDNLSAVDAVVQRSRARGVVEGQTDNSCILKYVLRTDDIEAGDVVISSGLDSIYPKGIQIGQVTKVNKKSYGISQDVEIKPSVDFSKLEEVLVILKPPVHSAISQKEQGPEL